VKQIKKGEYHPLPEATNPDLKDLIAGMLKIDPKARYDIAQCLQHPWMNEHSQISLPLVKETGSPLKIDNKVIERL